MRKYNICIALFFLIVTSVSGQKKSDKVEILWGKEFKESRRSTLSDIVGHDQTGIYVLREKARGTFYGTEPNRILEHYNNKMARTKSVMLKLKAYDKDTKFEFMLSLHGELYLFTSFRNQKLKQNFLFRQHVNKNTLMPDKELKKIAEIDYSGRGKKNAGVFNVSMSRDSSKVLIYYDLPYNKGEPEQYGFCVLDNDLNELWTKEVTLPYNDELFDIEDYKVSNNGDVYLLGALYKDKHKEKRNGVPNYHYEILGYTQQGAMQKEYPVQVKGRFLTDMKIAINDHQDIVCGGFYSEEGSFSIKGSYFLRIDGLTEMIVSQNYNEFGMDFITQNLTSRQERKKRRKDARGKNVELYKYHLDDVILRNDGGAVLVGEQFFVETVTTTVPTGNGGVSTTVNYYYYFNDIIVINVAPDGRIAWTEKIPKRQVSTNDGGFYSSYAHFVKKDKLYFIFNDNPQNLYYNGEGRVAKFTRGRESQVVLVTLDREGQQTREALFSNREMGTLIRPMVCEKISGQEMILFGQRKKKQRFARVWFKE